MKGHLMPAPAYNTVDDLVQDILGPAAVAGMRQHEESTKIIHTLASLRNDKHLSQRQLAKLAGWSPSKMNRFEASADRALAVGDILDYTKALNVAINLTLSDNDLPAAAKIKHHVLNIKDLLDTLAVIAAKQNDDPGIVNKIHQFYGEVLFNFSLKFADSHQRLPPAFTTEPAPAPRPQAKARSAVRSHTAELVPA